MTYRKSILRILVNCMTFGEFIWTRNKPLRMLIMYNPGHYDYDYEKTLIAFYNISVWGV